MKRKILIITGIISVLSVMCSLYCWLNYYPTYDIEKEYSLLNKLIGDIKDERKIIKENKKKLEEVKEKNSNKISLLEVWEKEKEKTKNQ